jgi:hypothetical protein
MRIAPIISDSRASIKEKARLNICIAKDLEENFGGRKSEYLIRLNRKLRMKIAENAENKLIFCFSSACSAISSATGGEFMSKQ